MQNKQFLQESTVVCDLRLHPQIHLPRKCNEQPRGQVFQRASVSEAKLKSRSLKMGVSSNA